MIHREIRERKKERNCEKMFVYTRCFPHTYFRLRCCVPGGGGNYLNNRRVGALSPGRSLIIELATVVCSDIITLQYEEALI